MLNNMLKRYVSSLFLYTIISLFLYRIKVDPRELAIVKKNSINFFTEVVFRLCFGQSHAPEEKLVMMLLDVVFTKERSVPEYAELKHGTRKLTPFKDTAADETPVINSFLLQLLMEHKYV